MVCEAVQSSPYMSVYVLVPTVADEGVRGGKVVEGG